MLWSRWRRRTGIYLALFFLAVTAAPHHHINGLEDLLLDHPSDSGTVVMTGRSIGMQGPPAWSAGSLVDDDPCLACFGNDFVSAPSAVFAFTARLERLALRPDASSDTEPAPLPRETPSRSPPSLS